MVAPDVSYRLLGLFRLWSVIDRFYPFKNLIGDWEAVLREFIPRFETAEGADAYARAVLELAARIEDGHVDVTGPLAVWNVIGARMLPLEVRPVEGRFIVTAKAKELPPGTDIAIGDEIVTVDGEPLVERVKRLWKYFPASTEEARRVRVVERALRGPNASIADLGVRGSNGKVRSVKIARVRVAHVANDGPAWRVLEHDIGYINMSRLPPGQAGAALDAMKDTKALIFDMRGYPQDVGYSIASRINRKHATAGALFIRPEISPSSSDQSNTRHTFEQRLESTGKPMYTAPTAMLIDDRTYSQAELTALWFQAASGTTFIGSNSAGEDGVVTATVLPGGIEVTFTGDEFRSVDGRRLQRIGIVPDVRVTPTIRGIRAGKDEVLDAAIAAFTARDRTAKTR
jgi:C-terminal processing protease CtpA/Prc